MLLAGRLGSFGDFGDDLLDYFIVIPVGSSIAVDRETGHVLDVLRALKFLFGLVLSGCFRFSTGVSRFIRVQRSSRADIDQTLLSLGRLLDFLQGRLLALED